MKEEDGVKLSQTLYARAEKIWLRYLCHPFVTQMADGTLPPEKFRYYSTLTAVDVTQLPQGHRHTAGFEINFLGKVQCL